MLELAASRRMRVLIVEDEPVTAEALVAAEDGVVSAEELLERRDHVDTRSDSEQKGGDRG